MTFLIILRIMYIVWVELVEQGKIAVWHTLMHCGHYCMQEKREGFVFLHTGQLALGWWID